MGEKEKPPAYKAVNELDGKGTAPPQYQVQPDDLPDLSSRLNGLKLERDRTRVSVFFVR